MESVSQIASTLTFLMTQRANEIARETGFIQRERQVTGANFFQTLVFGWLQQPQISLCGLTQVMACNRTLISTSGLNQRFTPQAAQFLQRMLEELTAARIQSQLEAPIALLKQFSAVILEDSSSITLPAQLVQVWRGCGGAGTTSEAAVKLFVQWDVLNGGLRGPSLTDGRHSDARSPFPLQDLPAGCLLLRDQGFSSQHAFGTLNQRSQCGSREKRFFISRIPPRAVLFTRRGHRIVLAGILPQQVGERLEMGVLMGAQARIYVRLIIERVPPDVAELRRTRLREEAADHGRKVDEETLAMTDWTLVITNVPHRLLKSHQVILLAHLRWQIELLFRLWKDDGQIDVWHSCQPWRILCEVYAKLCAMVIQQWLVEAGTLQEPHRSIVKAAQVVRRESNRLLVALRRGELEQEIEEILFCMSAGCTTEKRDQWPSMAQWLLEERPFEPQPRPPRPRRRRRDQDERWATGKGWGHSKPSRPQSRTQRKRLHPA